MRPTADGEYGETEQYGREIERLSWKKVADEEKDKDGKCGQVRRNGDEGEAKGEQFREHPTEGPTPGPHGSKQGDQEGADFEPLHRV